MTLIGNNGTGKSDWYGTIGTILAKGFTGEVFEGLAVVAQGSPGMSVKVQPGTAMVASGTAPAAQNYLLRHDTAAGIDLTVPTANGSNPRLDVVVGYYKVSVIDAVAPNNPGALQFAYVAGLPASTPAEPNATAIQAAVGAGNPYIILGRVSVATGATQVTTPNIIDRRSMAGAVLAPGSVKASSIDTSSISVRKEILTPKTGVIVSGALVDVTDWNITKTVLAVQEIEIEFYCPHAYSSTDAARVDFHIVDDLGNKVQSTLFRMWTSPNGGNQLRVTGRYKPVAGDRTWRLRVQQSGNVTVTLWAQSDSQFGAKGLIEAKVVG